MNKPQKLLWVLASIAAINLTTPADAQTFQPPNTGAPPSSAGGGVRSGNAPNRTPSVIPLIPKDANNRLWGNTLSASPTFYLYAPANFTTPVRFSLIDEEDGEVIYENVIRPSGRSGIIPIALPNQQTLREDRLYSVYFDELVNPTSPQTNPSVGGYVRRVRPGQELSDQLQAAGGDRTRTAEVLARNGIWYDLVTLAAQMRESRPTNWEQLLSSVGLANLVREPIVQTPGATTRPNPRGS